MSSEDQAAGGCDEVQILIVDDDEISVIAIRRAINKLKIVNPVRVAKDGIEGLEILRGSSGHAQLLPPFIVLLDINMPRMNGHEFLEEVRKDPSLHRAVVFVLTTSDASEDVLRAYDKNVAGYVVKEDPYETLKKTLELVDLYSKLVIMPN